MFLFGSLFVLLAICTDSIYALISGTFGTWLKGSSAFPRVQRYVAGSLYIGLGVTTAFTGSRRK